MTIEQILALLIAERNKLSQALAALQGRPTPGAPAEEFNIDRDSYARQKEAPHLHRGSTDAAG